MTGVRGQKCLISRYHMVLTWCRELGLAMEKQRTTTSDLRSKSWEVNKVTVQCKLICLTTQGKTPRNMHANGILSQECRMWQVPSGVRSKPTVLQCLVDMQNLQSQCQPDIDPLTARKKIAISLHKSDAGDHKLLRQCFFVWLPLWRLEQTWSTKQTKQKHKKDDMQTFWRTAGIPSCSKISTKSILGRGATPVTTRVSE